MQAENNFFVSLKASTLDVICFFKGAVSQGTSRVATHLFVKVVWMKQPAFKWGNQYGMKQFFVSVLIMQTFCWMFYERKRLIKGSFFSLITIFLWIKDGG